MNHSIFLGFIGQPCKKFQSKDIIADGFECWNLRCLSEKEFFSKIGQIILPNNNRTSHFSWSFPKASHIRPSAFQHASWGILLPLKDLGNEPQCMLPEVLLFINLYCSTFIDPDFYIDSLGLTVLNKTPTLRGWDYQLQELSSSKFKDFYALMSPIAKYHVWKDDDARHWSSHDWQAHYVSRMFMDGIKSYHNSGRGILDWQREIAELMTIAECLLTSESTNMKKEKITERTTILLSEVIADIGTEIPGFYNERSNFVHGATFRKFQRKIKENPDLNTLVTLIPDFDLLDKYRKYTRLLIITCFYLKIKVPTDEYLKDLRKCHLGKLIAHCIVQDEVKEKVLTYVREILACLPESQILSQEAIS